MDIKKLKKVELHVHLDGSVDVETFSTLTRVDLTDARKLLSVGNNCQDLNDYLRCFDAPVKFMQSSSILNLVAKKLVSSLENDNVIYAEVRFAPNKHTNNLKIEEVIESVLEGLKSDKVKVNLILCMMRGDNFEDNLRVIDMANKYRDSGVVGIDLAGAESLYKTKDYEKLFKYAESLKIPFTIHAGEADGVESINSAISFGATRIGHGVRSLESEECLDSIKNKNILLEMCPTSNIQTGICSSILTHPIKKLFDMGICLNINTDNRTVSNITLNEEYTLLEKSFNFTEDDFNNMNIEAIKHAFISEDEKKELIKKIEETN